MKKIYVLLLLASALTHTSEKSLKLQTNSFKKPAALTKEELLFVPDFLDELEKEQSFEKSTKNSVQKPKIYKKRKLSDSQKTQSKNMIDNTAAALIVHNELESNNDYFSDFEEDNVFCFKRGQFITLDKTTK